MSALVLVKLAASDGPTTSSVFLINFLRGVWESGIDLAMNQVYWLVYVENCI